jgi:hypothetical protein
MGIIRFSDEEVFGTDSSEYEILCEGAAKIKDIPGAVVEIGSRRGGSAKLIIDTLVANDDTNRSMFCIDPYGDIEVYCTNLNITQHNIPAEITGDPNSVEDFVPLRFGFDNQMRNRVIPSLYYYAYQRGLNFQFFCLEDNEFFKAFPNGVPVYDRYKEYMNSYAFVFFDGPHINDALIEEVNFFGNRAPMGAVWVFDDVWMYNHKEIEDIVLGYGFDVITRGNVKISYVKVR